MKISRLTRRNLIADLQKENLEFEGCIDMISFIKEVWPIEKMKSTDSRFETAEEDILQHTVRNDDWDFSFLYFDYLKILEIDDTLFIRFLEVVLDPEKRVNREEYDKITKIISDNISNDGYGLVQSKSISGYPIYKVLKKHEHSVGAIKNLIFASNGYKPEIVIEDALENVVRIVKNSESCLVYDRDIPIEGLFWSDLIKWWGEKEQISDINEINRSLYERLFVSLDSYPEKIFFDTYMNSFGKMNKDFPALVPQVYLHYDPYSIKQLVGVKRLERQRMDFLLLLPNKRRIIIEIDGVQHYSFENKPSPSLYSKMVSEDRSLKLKGYEVFRFGGYELTQESTSLELIISFFNTLFKST